MRCGNRRCIAGPFGKTPAGIRTRERLHILSKWSGRSANVSSVDEEFTALGDEITAAVCGGAYRVMRARGCGWWAVEISQIGAAAAAEIKRAMATAGSRSLSDDCSELLEPAEADLVGAGQEVNGTVVEVWYFTAPAEASETDVAQRKVAQAPTQAARQSIQ